MKRKILASTKEGYELTPENAIMFSGKEAGICYMPGTTDELFAEPEILTLKRSENTLKSGHHSVFDHPTYNFVFEEIPKVLAMLLNNEKEYTTSEKSARYTQMEPSYEEKPLYEKWILIFEDQIHKLCPEIQSPKTAYKLAMENARYLLSVFNPTTTMGYTTSLRQINYILHWCKNQKINKSNTHNNYHFSALLSPILRRFYELNKDLYIPELDDSKDRGFSLLASRLRKEEWGENYCCNYLASFAQVAQIQRHRTISYEISVPEEYQTFYTPRIIRGTKYEDQWLSDISSLSNLYPQGMLVWVNERGTVEDFVLKCKERLCGATQLETAQQTSITLKRYLTNTSETNKDVYNYLLKYSKGARCTFPDYKCIKPCVWKASKALDRLI